MYDIRRYHSQISLLLLDAALEYLSVDLKFVFGRQILVYPGNQGSHAPGEFEKAPDTTILPM